MTGFGKAILELKDRRFSTEISSVNHRFCEIALNLPSVFSPFEHDIKRFIRDRVRRGKVTVIISVEGEPAGTRVSLNKEVAKKCVECAKELGAELGMSDDISLGTALGLPGIWNIRPADPGDLEAYRQQLFQCLEQALEQLVDMRKREGEALRVDLLKEVARTTELVEKIKARAPTLVEEYRAKLADRVADLSRGLEVPEERVAMEVALVADKCDVSEEIVRFRSHVDQFSHLSDTDGAIGRQLEFLIQEMHREINTVGAKARDSDMSHTAIEIKGHLERLREQVQNVE